MIHTDRQLVVEAVEGLGVLQVHLINAFNLVDREAAFKEVEKYFPDCLQWVLTCYGVEAELLLGDFQILSSTGFHQGCTVAGLLFCLVLQPIIERIQLEVPFLLLNGWYLDDGVNIGKKEELQKVVDIIMEDGPARGLFLSTSASGRLPSLPKSTVWWTIPSIEEITLGPGIPTSQESGFSLLGTPIGDHQYVEQAIINSVRKVQLITAQLPCLEDAHLEFALLRSCLSLPKMMYTLRTIDPTPHQTLWKEVDIITREALNCILGVPLGSTQWEQAQLPVSLGGLGLRSAEEHAPAAFTTSVLASQDLKERILNLPEHLCPPVIPASLLALLSDKQGEEATVDNFLGVSQKAASYKIDLHT